MLVGESLASIASQTFLARLPKRAFDPPQLAIAGSLLSPTGHVEAA